MPQIIVDSREKAPMDIIKLYEGNIKIETLDVGDYCCSCRCTGIERKEQDIYNMQRTLTQVEELKKAYKYPYLIINMSCDTFLNSPKGNKFAKKNFISSLMRRQITPLFIKDYHAMLTIIRQLIIKHHDGKQRGYNEFAHQRHVSSKDVRINVLTSLPGIGKEKAQLILKKFGTIEKFFNATPKEIESLPGFGPKSVEKIIDCLHNKE